MVIQRERTEERGYDETERGPDTPWVFERSKWFKKTQKKFKGHHNLGYIPVSTMALLMDIFRVCKRRLDWGVGVEMSVGVGNHSAVSQARLKHLTHISSAPISYFED